MSKRTISYIIKQIGDSIPARANQEKYHGVILIPEVLVEREVARVGGRVIICGSMAYVPQIPRMLTCNIKENILENPYNHENYERSLHAYALKRDIDSYSCGDLTEIGESGTNISSRLKQRIHIVKAVHQDADIYFLDDPFSAFDLQTGTIIFKECLKRMPRDKNILYVTNQVEFLLAAEHILLMENGKIEKAGGFRNYCSKTKDSSYWLELIVSHYKQPLMLNT
ncbi:hypothetical protein J5N97_022343 [Dioscorea zingiberensis]|uniref:ABC transporter domain-containing protein n=1 Tax=Dioscorea zingiberensis TaxID=325984 RepID=A0A9D5HAH1_9LILI|nr:hypothetical protein J5N97_022343 [Dioscorea zingiberensis]